MSFRYCGQGWKPVEWMKDGNVGFQKLGWEWKGGERYRYKDKDAFFYYVREEMHKQKNGSKQLIEVVRVNYLESLSPWLDPDYTQYWSTPLCFQLNLLEWSHRIRNQKSIPIEKSLCIGWENIGTWVNVAAWATLKKSGNKKFKDPFSLILLWWN